MQIAVIGGAVCTPTTSKLAYEVGKLLAERRIALICGGLGGVMEAAARGAREAGGVVVGILPGSDPQSANPYISISIVTGLGHARNVLVVQSAEAVIAFPGGFGTLSEIALAGKIGRAVIDFGGWTTIPGLHKAERPDQAVQLALDLVGALEK